MKDYYIEFNPKNIKYKDFKEIDTICFPDEPIIEEDEFYKLTAKYFWAVIYNERFVGYSYLTFKEKIAWISRITVLPNYRCIGIGTQLMNLMIGSSKKNSKEKIILYVLQNNSVAKHLYEKCGFSVDETTYQFVIPIKEVLSRSKNNSITAKPMNKIVNKELFDLPQEWINIKESHDPPKNYVFMFINNMGKVIGYCRLNPGFPGCFPFNIDNPKKNLIDSLNSLEQYLKLDKKELKLTFADIELEKACVINNFKLNYKLYKMTKVI